MNILTLKTNKEKEDGGVRVPFIGGTFITVRSKDSKLFRDALRAKLAPFETAISLQTIDDETLRDLSLQTIAAAGIVGWEGFTETVDGVEQEVTYSAKKAYEYLRDVPKFREFVEAQLSRFDNFREAQEEAETKN